MSKYYHYAVKIHDSLRAGTAEENPLYLTTKPNEEGERVVIDGVECADWLFTPGTISSSIDPTASTCSVSSIKLKTINKNYTISQWLYERTNSDETMTYGEKVEVWAIKSESSLELIYTGVIRSINNDSFGSYYEFEVTDFQEKLKTSIFDREFSEYSSEVIADINTYRLPGDSTNGFEMVEQVEDGKMVKVIKFRGHVIDFVEMVFQIAFSTNTLEVQTSYLSTNWKDFVDTETLDEIRVSLSGVAYEFYFEFREAVSDPYDFLNTNIYQPCAIFPYVNTEGKLGLELHQQPVTGTEGITISEENILKVNSVKMTDNNMVNYIKVLYGWDFIEDEAATARMFANSASFSKFKMLIPTVSPKEYEIKGINNLSDTDKATFAQSLTDAMFSRYALPLQEVNLTVPLEVGNQWRVGNYLFLSHRHIIGWEGENQGSPGIGGENSFVDLFGGLAYFNEGHEWGGFVEGNNLGKSINGKWVVNTQTKEITTDIFIGAGVDSCLENHVKVDEWLISQGW